MWNRVVDWLFADTFLIDETPLSVMTQARGEGEAGAARDMMETIAHILREREALELRARELESQAGDPEAEFRMMRQMLPVLDAMERVMECGRDCPPSPELDNWLKSVETVYFRLLKTLRRLGLEPLECAGKPVDLDTQEVVEYIPSTEYGHNFVVSERAKGYRFKGRLLRDAKVVVAYNPKNG